jgi:hypothetical protein
LRRKPGCGNTLNTILRVLSLFCRRNPADQAFLRPRLFDLPFSAFGLFLAGLMATPGVFFISRFVAKAPFFAIDFVSPVRKAGRETLGA